MSLRYFAVALLVVCGCALALIGEEAKPGRKFAFLVGVGDYKHESRENQLGAPPVNDVREMKKVLEAAGFQVVMLIDDDATQAKVVAAFDLLLEGKLKASDAKNALGNRDLLLVQLCGHGIQVDATDPEDPEKKKKLQPFLKVYDSKPTDTDTMIPFNAFVRKASENRVRTLFLVDACRVNADPNLRGRSGITSRNVNLPDGISILFSCAQGQEAQQDDKVLKHGVFTYAVLKTLRGQTGRTGKLRWGDFTSDVMKQFEEDEEILAVLNGSKKRQTPITAEGQNESTSILSLASIPKAPMPSVPVEVEATGNETIEEFEWKGEKRKRLVRTLILGGEKMEFVQVPKGSFTMGSPDSDKEARDDEKPAHRVTFTKPLWVAKYATTKGQFAAFAKAATFTSEAEADGKGGYGYDGTKLKQDAEYTWKNTGWTQTDKHPVVNVSWNDAEAFAKWASETAKKPIRLLSEAEYEYANRAGSSTRYFTGDGIESLEGYGNVSDSSDSSVKAKIAIFTNFTAAPFDDGYVFTSPVGVFKPNGFGLYDMTGNVWSWCGDAYNDKLYATRSDGVSDPKTIVYIKKSIRVLRGGSWLSGPAVCRVACRDDNAPAHRVGVVGFRVALD